MSGESRSSLCRKIEQRLFQPCFVLSRVMESISMNGEPLHSHGMVRAPWTVCPLTGRHIIHISVDLCKVPYQRE